MAEIPVIDFSGFAGKDSSQRVSVVQQVYQACHEVGFMYLQNVDVSRQLIAEVFAASQSFFAQPLVDKQQIAWQDETSNCGYVGMERERLNPDCPGDLKEAFNVSRTAIERISENLPLSPFPDFYMACTRLAAQVLEALALALELPADFFSSRHENHNHTLRLLHYPPLTTLPKSGQMRAGEHSDYGSITLLFQHEISGLEVQTTDGEWIAAPVIPGTVVVNTGDLMQRWTNHKFCSTKHRSVVPQDERASQSRYAIAFFIHPSDDTEIACVETCTQDQPPLYAPIRAGDYLLSRLQATY